MYRKINLKEHFFWIVSSTVLLHSKTRKKGNLKHCFSFILQLCIGKMQIFQTLFDSGRDVLQTNFTIFGLKMMVKSGLLWNSMCPFRVAAAQCKNLPKKAELAWQDSRYLWSGMWNFKIGFSRPLSTIIFKPKMVISRLLSLVHL